MLTAIMPWTTMCDLNELQEGQGKYVEIDGLNLAVFLHKGEPRVMDNRCPHAGGSMAEGWVDNEGCAICPWHGWGFDLTNGHIKGGSGKAIEVYVTRVHEFNGRKLVQADLPMA